MGLTSSIANMETPPFYFELGQLISSTGHCGFARDMLQLVDKLVPVSQLLLSEWTLDERQASSLAITLLGRAGLQEDLPLPEPPRRHDPLLHKMLEMDDSLLIQMNAQAQGGTSRSRRSDPPAGWAWRHATCAACRRIRTGTPPRYDLRRTAGRPWHRLTAPTRS